jgi:hypothetical protein
MRVAAVVGFLVTLVAAGPAPAKDAPRALLVCGQSACREDRGEAWRQASTIQMHHQRAPRHGGRFYDVAVLDGSGKPGIALRYVPSLRLTRQSRAHGAVWYRARPALVQALGALTAGLTPRPASALDSPPGLPLAYRPRSEVPAPVAPGGMSAVVLAAAGLLVLALAALVALRRARRRRPGYPAARQQQPRGSH